MLSPAAVCFALVLLLRSVPAARSDDQHCMNKATKIIPVNIINDNPNKVMTFVRDDPGYARNLDCKWELKASDYSKPRQMLLTVRNVDFDLNNATAAQCSSSAVDVFSFAFSGQLTEGQISSQRWCSKSDAEKVPKLMLANLWNSSHILTVQFKSDNTQVRSDAKGVELDVVMMAEDYCHRDMLFHNGDCYLITEDQLTFHGAFWAAKHLLGNVATFRDNDTVRQFLMSNTDRQNVFPYKPPLNLATRKVWTGQVWNCPDSSGLIWFADSRGNCSLAQSTVPVECNCSGDSRLLGVALQMTNGAPVFTCEPMNSTLPALVFFAHIPGINLRPHLFVTCDFPTLTDRLNSLKQSGCRTDCKIIVSVIALCFVILAGVGVYAFASERRKESAAGRTAGSVRAGTALLSAARA